MYKQRAEIMKLNTTITKMNSDAKQLSAAPIDCPKCAQRKQIVMINKEQQVDIASIPAYNLSAIITEQENSRLKDELSGLRKKYDNTKKLCQMRRDEISKLQNQMSTTTSNNNAMVILIDCI